MTSGWGLQQRPTSPITKKYSTLKIKIDNEAVQKACQQSSWNKLPAVVIEEENPAAFKAQLAR